ncbi:MAG: hypothetical protein LBN06_12195 [Prevotellaceae bacterium]|nr:hypothetical protein [Prevotellaceae bacterium]
MMQLAGHKETPISTSLADTSTERWLNEHSATEAHVMHSVSKTFTATVVGFAVRWAS